MIHVTDIVKLLRSKLEDVYRVDAAAEFFAVEDRSRLKLPAFYVALGTYTATPIAYDQGYRQTFDERFKIIYACPNTISRTGKYAQDTVPIARQALWNCLLNKQLTQGQGHGITYVGDQMMEMDLAKYFHQFEFQIVGEIGPDDAQPDDWVDLKLFYADFDLTESDPLDVPNAQAIINLETVI